MQFMPKINSATTQCIISAFRATRFEKLQLKLAKASESAFKRSLVRAPLTLSALRALGLASLMALNFPYRVVMGAWQGVGAVSTWMFPVAEERELTDAEKQEKEEKQKTMCAFCSVVRATHSLLPCEHIICGPCKHSVLSCSNATNQDPACPQCKAAVVSFEDINH